MRGAGSPAVQRYLRARTGVVKGPPDDDASAAPPPLVVEPLGPSQRVPVERGHEVIDLLNPEPAIVVDTERLRWALSFGFAGGDIGGVLTRAMRRAPIAASAFRPEAFASGLFVHELIRGSMQVRLGGFSPQLDATFVARVLTQPPRDAAVVSHRQAIVRELAGDPALRERFAGLYRELHRVRALLESEGPVRELDGRRRRLEVLGGLRDVLSSMDRGFDACSSGLTRIARFARHVLASEAYRHLSELLDYDNHLASVELELRIGSDGRVRHFAIAQLRENRENRFYQSPLGRLLARLGLLLRGFALGEPEIADRFVDAVFEDVLHVLPPLLQLMGEMEVYLATLAFKDTAESRGLSICLAELRDVHAANAESLGYRGLWNPLLLGNAGTITACDLPGSAFRATTLVTGPNSGGKTRLLQAVALAQLLGQAGLFLPAQAATLERASGLFVSLIEEARADQKEGRLGTELMRIRELFERARPGSLIVLDELCSGTNPSEGEEIIRLVLSLLGQLHSSVFITTHFLQFAKCLSDERPASTHLSFLQVELDAHEQPTYRFVPGVAQTSLAHRTAARLGVTREELLALIERNGRGEE
jgi:DNA mismatch repair protein MutS2